MRESAVAEEIDTELEELNNEPNIVNVIKSSRLRRSSMCDWVKTNYLKVYYGQTLEVNEDFADRNQDGFMG
jgi:hypothetical protein